MYMQIQSLSELPVSYNLTARSFSTSKGKVGSILKSCGSGSGRARNLLKRRIYTQLRKNFSKADSTILHKTSILILYGTFNVSSFFYTFKPFFLFGSDLDTIRMRNDFFQKIGSRINGSGSTTLVI